MKNKLAQFKMGPDSILQIGGNVPQALSPSTSLNLISREWNWKAEFRLRDILYSGSCFRMQSLEILIAFPKPHFNYFQMQK